MLPATERTHGLRVKVDPSWYDDGETYFGELVGQTKNGKKGRIKFDVDDSIDSIPWEYIEKVPKSKKPPKVAIPAAVSRGYDALLGKLVPAELVQKLMPELFKAGQATLGVGSVWKDSYGLLFEQQGEVKRGQYALMFAHENPLHSNKRDNKKMFHHVVRVTSIGRDRVGETAIRVGDGKYTWRTEGFAIPLSDAQLKIIAARVKV